jgi:hypothetical protein
VVGDIRARKAGPQSGRCFSLDLFPFASCAASAFAYFCRRYLSTTSFPAFFSIAGNMPTSQETKLCVFRGFFGSG